MSHQTCIHFLTHSVQKGLGSYDPTQSLSNIKLLKKITGDVHIRKLNCLNRRPLTKEADQKISEQTRKQPSNRQYQQGHEKQTPAADPNGCSGQGEYGLLRA